MNEEEFIIKRADNMSVIYELLSMELIKWNETHEDKKDSVLFCLGTIKTINQLSQTEPNPNVLYITTHRCEEGD